MRSIAFIIVLSLLSSIYWQAQGPSSAVVKNSWFQTHLRFRAVPLLFNDMTCHQSQNHFLGCLSLAKTWIRKIQPQWQLSPIQQLPGKGSRKVGAVGGFLIQDTPVSKAPLLYSSDLNGKEAEEFRHLLRDRELEWTEWKIIYSQGSSRFSFDELRTWLLLNLTPTEEIQEVFTSSLLNAFLKFADDAHSRMIPSAPQESQVSAFSKNSAQEEGLPSEIFHFQGSNILKIDLSDFQSSDLCKDFAELLFKNRGRALDGIVIDLRGNPGGLVSEAMCLMSIFVGPHKKIIALKSIHEDKVEILETKRSQLTHLPLTVLVDSLSASSSEILAGSLQELERGFIVGERTFGKGSVQNCSPWPQNSYVQVCLTEALYGFPSGATVQRKGLEPDWFSASTEHSLKDRFRETELFPHALSAMENRNLFRRSAFSLNIRNCIQSRFQKFIAPQKNSDPTLRTAIAATLCQKNTGKEQYAQIR